MSRSYRQSSRSRALGFGALAAAGALILTSCASDPAPEAAEETEEHNGRVTLIVHDSFPAEEFQESASAATGLDVNVITSGDSGELATQLALTANDPVADAFYGVDNLYVSRIVEAGAVDPYVPDNLPAGAADRAYDEAGSVTPIDYGSTCINIDHGWFAEQSLPEPETLEDLASEEYEGLTVVIDPTSSSTGATFLIGTVSHFGEDGFADYWASLVDNGVEISDGWTAAYNGAFTQGGEDGTKPIVLSYSTSPAWTLTEDGTESTTKILPETCSQHVEYAGVLEGAQNPAGAREVIDYLVSTEFQDTIADTMFMYPVDESAAIPDEWSDFAEIPEGGGLTIPADQVGEKRDDWLRTWSEAVGF